MTKIEEAFNEAWEEGFIGVGDEGVSRCAFVAGARAFSTMPLCEHGAAIWAGEECGEGCKGTDESFPGYNKPFQADLPEGLTEGHFQDLLAEHEVMRSSLIQVLIKVGVIDKEAVNAPWDAVRLVHFVGLWMSDGMPWVKNGKTHRELAAAVRDLHQRVSKLEEGQSALDRIEKELSDEEAS
jgi:hypothetical protein